MRIIRTARKMETVPIVLILHTSYQIGLRREFDERG